MLVSTWGTRPESDGEGVFEPTPDHQMSGSVSSLREPADCIARCTLHITLHCIAQARAYDAGGRRTHHLMDVLFPTQDLLSTLTVWATGPPHNHPLEPHYLAKNLEGGECALAQSLQNRGDGASPDQG